MMTTQKQIRESFWESHPQYTRKGKQTQNAYKADIRMAFCDYTEALYRNGEIKETLWERVTL